MENESPSRWFSGRSRDSTISVFPDAPAVHSPRFFVNSRVVDFDKPDTVMLKGDEHQPFVIQVPIRPLVHDVESDSTIVEVRDEHLGDRR